MDFELTREQRALQKAAREFAEGELDRDLALEQELDHAFPRALWQKACALGLVCMHYPEEYGGQGYGLLEQVLVVEQLCRQDSGLGTAIILASFGSDLLLRFGSEEQKEKWLPLVASGKAISGAAFTEPNRGDDLTGISTVATKDHDTWIIQGVKSPVANGSIADFVILLCQTDPSARPPQRGLSTFLVETDRTGLEIASLTVRLGLKMTPNARLTFLDMRLPASSLLGEENCGFSQVIAFLHVARVLDCAMALGIAQGAFDRALAYAKQREAFGRRITEFQAIQHKLADMAMKIETARLATYRAAWGFDRGKVDARTSSTAKLYAARAAVEVCEDAVQILGGHGYMLENEVERFWRDARVIEIHDGTLGGLRDNIASYLVGRGESY